MTGKLLSALALIVLAPSAALAADGEELLDDAERTAILAALANLEAVRQGSDLQAIKQAISATDAVTQDFAARRMDAGMRKALTGHTLDEFTSGK